MLRDRHGTPTSLPAYVLVTAAAVLAAWWSNTVAVDSTAVVALVSAVGAVALVSSAVYARDVVSAVLGIFACLRTVATARQPVPPRPTSLEPIDSAALLRVVSVSEPRASNRAG